MHDNPYITLTSNFLGNYEEERNTMNYVGQILNKTIVHSKFNIEENYTYTYDHAGRPLKTFHRVKNNTYMDSVCLENNTYNEIGQLIRRVTANGRDTVRYTYNIQGWLTDLTSNYFKEHLYYETKRDSLSGNYNGNISQMDIQYRAGGYSNFVSLKLDNTYDQLNRLTNSSVENIGSNVDRFGEDISYDKHGNITTLARGGITTHSWTNASPPLPNHNFGTVDQLSYTYDGNQVKSISDNSSVVTTYLGAQDFKDNASTSEEYSYDSNGNQIKDLNKNLVTIKYNSLNLPDVVQRGDGNMVDYSYDALGRKEEVKRVTVVGSGISLPIGRTLNDTTLANVTKYTENVRYAANVTYDNNAMTDIQIPGGYLKRTDMYTNSNTRPVYAYCYYVNDHLGNIRAVIDGTGAIKQVNNYTPFGTEYGESAQNSSMYTYQNYQYGGKEFDRKFELNLSDFGARSYDAAKGRWITMDPLAEKRPWISPYVYCGNNPLNRIDPDGKWDFLNHEQIFQKIVGAAQRANSNMSGIASAKVSASFSAFSFGGNVNIAGSKVGAKIEAASVTGSVSTQKASLNISVLKVEGNASLPNNSLAKAAVNLGNVTASIDKESNITTERKLASANAKIENNGNQANTDFESFGLGAKFGPVVANVELNIVKLGKAVVGLIDFVGTVASSKMSEYLPNVTPEKKEED